MKINYSTDMDVKGKNMKLYFENSQGEEKLLGEYESHQACYDAMMKFCEEHNFKSRYQRFWEDENGTHYDVGSHTKFFRMK